MDNICLTIPYPDCFSHCQTIPCTSKCQNLMKQRASQNQSFYHKCCCLINQYSSEHLITHDGSKLRCPSPVCCSCCVYMLRCIVSPDNHSLLKGVRFVSGSTHQSSSLICSISETKPHLDFIVQSAESGKKEMEKYWR